jgi:flagellar hook assembly protein FlgD
VTVDVYDLRGRFVRNLAAGRRGAGEHAVAWDGTGESGRPAAAGCYVVRVTAGARIGETKVMLLE